MPVSGANAAKPNNPFNPTPRDSSQDSSSDVDCAAVLRSGCGDNTAPVATRRGRKPPLVLAGVLEIAYPQVSVVVTVT